VLKAFAEATEKPGEWIQIFDSYDGHRCPRGWLLGFARQLAHQLNFHYDWRRNDGRTPQIKFEVAYARKRFMR